VALPPMYARTTVEEVTSREGDDDLPRHRKNLNNPSLDRRQETWFGCRGVVAALLAATARDDRAMGRSPLIVIRQGMVM
jgi:hypothetical protein